MLLPQQVLRQSFLVYGYFQKLWQLGSIYCDSPSLVTREQLGCGLLFRLVTHDKTRGRHYRAAKVIVCKRFFCSSLSLLSKSCSAT
jgi:hypothetical protein